MPDLAHASFTTADLAETDGDFDFAKSGSATRFTAGVFACEARAAAAGW